MVRRSGYPGVLDPDSRFAGMRDAVVRLRALELSQARPSPAGSALDHAVVAIRMAANLLTRRAEFYDLAYRADDAAYAELVSTFDALRPALQELRAMADAYHPATPESRALNHAAGALRMAADLLTGTPDYYRARRGDSSTGADRSL